MSQVLHPIEKKIIKFLRANPNSSLTQIEKGTKLGMDQCRRGVEWLKLKNYAIVKDSEKIFVSLGENGLVAKEHGLPEYSCVPTSFDQPLSISTVRSELKSDFDPAIGIARRNGWISIGDGFITLTAKPPENESPLLQLLKFIGEKKIPISDIKNKKSLEELKNRPGYLVFESDKSKYISLTPISETIQIQEDVIVVKKKSSQFEKSDGRAIDVEADTEQIFVAKTHPLNDTINEIREIFVTLGFSEILGNQTQSSFWNFDALFTPQDHPARELQDTFYLDGIVSKKIATPKQIQQVSKVHKKGWRYFWSISEAQKMVLRTHTTCVTIKYLAENKPDEARVFSLGRVFRNEKVSYKHLVEFNQIEGIVVGKNTTLRDLMGIQREFYRRLGLNKVKFWPTFFPYTEPSLQSMVYNERLKKWVELFGMGIFRQEVTKPLGITKPVLAWGGGIERIAMLKYELDDVRELYNNNLKWLRSVSKCP
ncbi:MAG: Phenylalanyl-tRNA synthetase alpha chain [Nitrosopumilales archaeon]|nr:MAG: Phenylalanyl-tRNA synthetase alpha chain [Nitrosopumilales archaeon]